MKSSLEIAQEATLRPIADIAREMGLEDDEVDLYGRYKAKVSLSAIDRLARAHRSRSGRGREHDNGGRGVGAVPRARRAAVALTAQLAQLLTNELGRNDGCEGRR